MKLITFILLLFSLSVYSQDQLSLNIYQDARLLAVGDNRGNGPGTLDIVARVEIQTNQLESGYVIAYPEFEYADLPGNYKRWSFNVGYRFNQFSDTFDLGLALGYGWIYRYSKAVNSLGVMGETAIKLNERLKLAFMLQGVQRSDLQWLWNDKTWRVSGFIGLKVNLL